MILFQLFIEYFGREALKWTTSAFKFRMPFILPIFPELRLLISAVRGVGFAGQLGQYRFWILASQGHSRRWQYVISRPLPWLDSNILNVTCDLHGFVKPANTFTIWMSNNIHMKLSYVISYKYIKFDNGSAIPSLYSGHSWMITSYKVTTEWSYQCPNSMLF